MIGRKPHTLLAALLLSFASAIAAQTATYGGPPKDFGEHAQFVGWGLALLSVSFGLLVALRFHVARPAAKEVVEERFLLHDKEHEKVAAALENMTKKMEHLLENHDGRLRELETDFASLQSEHVFQHKVGRG
jgi:Skp family chaperone for outer membrane proteins